MSGWIAQARLGAQVIYAGGPVGAGLRRRDRIGRPALMRQTKPFHRQNLGFIISVQTGATTWQ